MIRRHLRVCALGGEGGLLLFDDGKDGGKVVFSSRRERDVFVRLPCVAFYLKRLNEEALLFVILFPQLIVKVPVTMAVQCGV